MCFGKQMLFGLAPPSMANSGLKTPGNTQRNGEKYSFSPLSPTNSMLKNAIFGDNSAKLCCFSQKQRDELKND